MTAAHAPGFIVNHPDKTVRSILYVCWIATFNTPQHHMGLALAQSQVRCILFACHDGRNAHRRDEISYDVQWIVEYLHGWRVAANSLLPTAADVERYMDKSIAYAQSLARLRDLAVTP